MDAIHEGANLSRRMLQITSTRPRKGKKIVNWNCYVKKKRRWISPDINLYCIWKESVKTDPPTEEWLYYEYEGPIIIDGDTIIMRLKAKMYEEQSINIDDKKVRVMTKSNDPAFLVMHANVAKSSIRPCIVSGFDTKGNGYGAIGIFINDNIVLEDSEQRKILGDKCYLMYRDVEDRSFDYRISYPSDDSSASCK